MNPEIDRRCKTCGASVRPRALFCPQCGEVIVKQSNQTMEPNSTETMELAHAQDPAETQPLVALPEIAETQPLTALRPQTSEQSTRRLERASQAIPATEGNVKARVEKLRKVSTVVIDQAAYDPSLRFLLVAAVLFLLFVFLLILSKVLG